MTPVSNLSSLYHRAKVRFGRYGPGYRDKMGYWRDRLRSDYFEKTYGAEQVEKSETIARAFAEHCGDSVSLHEIGVGGGRNLYYLLRDRPGLAVSGNDLDRAQCFKFMRPEVQHALEFVQQDTLSFLNASVASSRTVDTLLTADHLIHIPPEAIPEILALIQRFAARTIVLHEAIRRRPERTDDFWWAHDYAALENDFELVYEEEREPTHFSEYVLRVYRKRAS